MEREYAYGRYLCHAPEPNRKVIDTTIRWGGEVALRQPREEATQRQYTAAFNRHLAANRSPWTHQARQEG
jgi:hypothetical protein